MLSKRIARKSLLVLAVAGVFLLATGPAWAQADAKPAATLKAGDKAPALAIEKWVKGDPVKGFEKGKVYVVEFWATWCGPCVASMPHLSAMQKAYKDKGVTFIGTNVWEDKEYTDATFKKVQDFVKAQGDRMSYTVAFDGKAKAMDAAYLKAAGQNGIPAAFLVDKTGTIAWIGHPMWLDIPLDAVVADKWDIKTGPAQIEKAQKLLNDVYAKAEGSPKEALTAFESFERDYPTLAHNMTDMKFGLLLAAGEFDKAYKLGGKMVDEAIAEKDSNKLNGIAWSIVDPEAKIAKRDLDLALKAATKADELTKHEDAATIDTLARVYFAKGDIAKAIELQTKAVGLADGRMKASLQKSLDEYQAAKEKK
jgi:thiol-disulfide isomerase/thioredoxin